MTHKGQCQRCGDKGYFYPKHAYAVTHKCLACNGKEHAK